MTNKPLLVIAGTTASGKTETAVELAHMIDGEVISADSMQVYKYMNIGTAKPSIEEMRGIRHCLIDELFPDEEYSAAVFQQKAAAYVEEINDKGKTPVIVGGTGFYINALINGNTFCDMEADHAYREELTAYAEKYGADALHAKLRLTDPEYADSVHANNVKRVIRALEYYKQTGECFSDHNAREKSREKSGKAVIFILSMERQELYKAIESRVDKMVHGGLADEVAGLLDMGYGEGLVSMQGLGYKELVQYIKGRTTLDEAVCELKKGTRHFAKRQMTWFTRQCDGIYVDVQTYETKRKIAEYISSVYKANLT